MSGKRPRDDDEDEQQVQRRSPVKRHESSPLSAGTFKYPDPPQSTPPTTAPKGAPSTPALVTKGILPPTPRTATRYGISRDESKDVLKRVDSFPALIMLVQRMVDFLGGDNGADSEFGKLLVQAAREITVGHNVLLLNLLTNRIHRSNVHPILVWTRKI